MLRLTGVRPRPGGTRWTPLGRWRQGIGLVSQTRQGKGTASLQTRRAPGLQTPRFRRWLRGSHQPGRAADSPPSLQPLLFRLGPGLQTPRFRRWLRGSHQPGRAADSPPSLQPLLLTEGSNVLPRRDWLGRQDRQRPLGRRRQGGRRSIPLERRRVPRLKPRPRPRGGRPRSGGTRWTPLGRRRATPLLPPPQPHAPTRNPFSPLGRLPIRRQRLRLRTLRAAYLRTASTTKAESSRYK